MAGRKPTPAVSAFLQPIRRALRCLTETPLSVSAMHHYELDKPYSWSLNDAMGVSLRGLERRDGMLYGYMAWKLIKDPGPLGPFRVTTLGYDYSMTLGNRELWAMHWHPEGRSNFREPHLHLKPMANAEGRPEHLPTPRMMFETAVRWAIEFGAEPIMPTWDDILSDTEQGHVRHRTWSQRIRDLIPS
ncbi:hypothetical protein [Micropruina glycogenica]|uniref:Uncharacterized protein n=1 Tax=Micropruina glycogenica TaxID=75385 RepID=A0A2N9JAS1_9ACTN|nr:hypothetical protein [Micropruina glycogenica]SPD85252.1 putative Uncharacterised protein [Micropruina glycogenica]